ncbi:acetyl-CoA carboxylase biotin carboxyl carrier protein [bacterium]|nr:acetyl-CoA carboxylase biotin carboxyl carrier protein [bacterium]
MPFSDDDIQWLLSLVEQQGLAEIEVHDGEDEVLVRRRDPVTTVVGTALAPGQLPVEEVAAEPVLPDNVVPVLAPMSGVFYRAPSPQSPPYVEVGQVVSEGDTVGLIEAMKLFNDVSVQVSGTVYQVIAENAGPVEAGATLMLIET